MKNYVQPGKTVTMTAAATIVAGAGVLFGSLFGVACGDAALGEDVEIMTRGVFDITKTSAQAWTAGDKVYWDNGNEECTTVAAGNVLIGVALADAVNPTSTGRVLMGSHPETELPTQVLTSAAALDFGSIAAVDSEDLTIAVVGAAVGDTVALGLPAAPTAGLVFNGFVSAADTVTVRATNITAGAVDPASASYTAMVFKL